MSAPQTEPGHSSRSLLSRAGNWLAQADSADQPWHSTIMIIALSGAVIIGIAIAIMELDVASHQARINDRLADPVRYYEAQRRYEEDRAREAEARRREWNAQIQLWREACRRSRMADCETLTSQ